MSARMSRLWLSAIVLGASWLLQVPAWSADTSGVALWLSEGIGTVAPEMHRIFSFLLWIAGAVFVLVQATLVIFIVRDRNRPGRRAGSLHGTHVIELVWTVIPALILAFLAFHSQRV